MKVYKAAWGVSVHTIGSPYPKRIYKGDLVVLLGDCRTAAGCFMLLTPQGSIVTIFGRHFIDCFVELDALL